MQRRTDCHYCNAIILDTLAHKYKLQQHLIICTLSYYGYTVNIAQYEKDMPLNLFVTVETETSSTDYTISYSKLLQEYHVVVDPVSHPSCIFTSDKFSDLFNFLCSWFVA